MKEQLKWTEAFLKLFDIISLALGHVWTLLLKMMVSLNTNKNTGCSIIHYLMLFPVIFFLLFIGYLYFSEGSRQTEYNFILRRVNRVLLNYGWLDCY